MSYNNGNEASLQSGRLTLEDGSVFEGYVFGKNGASAGEVVFNTGMVGYPDTLTDPSYLGQILVMTYPLVGNYGIPPHKQIGKLERNFESSRIQVKGLIVSDYSTDYSHWHAEKSLDRWLKEYDVPGLSGVDTRALTKKLRASGTMLGKIEIKRESVDWYNPNLENLVATASIDAPETYGDGKKTVVLIDCGAKNNIIHHLMKRGFKVIRVPWDHDLSDIQFDGLMISNGPGDPKMCRPTVVQIQETIARNIPVFGICMGHQLLALAAGADTFKLKYGHRSQNQPVLEVGTNHCLVTSQNHGFAVDDRSLPEDWSPWFVNLNDQTNEGIRHQSGRFMSVQFHPEAMPGPVDAEYLFDEFARIVNS